MGVVDEAVAAIKAGQLLVLPTDTVYGLASTPYREEPVRKMFRLKERPETSPIALVASSLDFLLECVPELRGRDATIARALLPGPYTLVLRNSARRFRWLAGDRAETIGVRVPELEGDAAAILEQAGAVAATSANLHGKPTPRTLDEVPEQIRSACAALVDGGELPGTASTVIDFTGPDPKVIREGAAPAIEAIDRVFAALR
jgi:tRNA threonylcarbamoyl adenosine modification protein (Sua5/YciO/YrdC/YwlC family)